jgi:hypothetical protein
MGILGFGRKPRVILTASLGPDVVAEVGDKRLPLEIQPSVQLKTPVFELQDSSGRRVRYDLSSAIAEGSRYAHLSIRVSERFAVEADCLLSNASEVPVEEFRRFETKGIRFQPFYLPECAADPSELIGRSLFFRGLHFPGTVTPGNVSLLCVCDSCASSFRLQSFHAGFSNLVYFYCGSGTHTLVASSYLDGAPPLLRDVPDEEIRAFEQRLPPCSACATEFRYYNPFRCPSCRAPYIDFGRFPAERKNEYYGNYLYGDHLQEFDSPSAS